jgi:hypothetical protein
LNQRYRRPFCVLFGRAPSASARQAREGEAITKLVHASDGTEASLAGNYEPVPRLFVNIRSGFRSARARI